MHVTDLFMKRRTFAVFGLTALLPGVSLIPAHSLLQWRLLHRQATEEDE